MGKKIVGIISFMNAAGAQEALLRLMRQLRQRGHDTEVWFLYAKSSCYRGQPGVRIILDKSRLSLFDLPVVFVRLLKLLRRFKPDAAIGFLPLANIRGWSRRASAACRCGSRRSARPAPPSAA